MLCGSPDAKKSKSEIRVGEGSEIAGSGELTVIGVTLGYAFQLAL